MLAKFIRDPKAYLRSRPRGVEPPPLIKSRTERPPKKNLYAKKYDKTSAKAGQKGYIYLV